MRCERLPDCAAGQWTLWLRRIRRPDRWRYLDCGSVTYLEDLLRCDADWLACCCGETVLLPPGESPVEKREECHRRREWGGMA